MPDSPLQISRAISRPGLIGRKSWWKILLTITEKSRRCRLEAAALDYIKTVLSIWVNRSMHWTTRFDRSCLQWSNASKGSNINLFETDLAGDLNFMRLNRFLIARLLTCSNIMQSKWGFAEVFYFGPVTRKSLGSINQSQGSKEFERDPDRHLSSWVSVHGELIFPLREKQQRTEWELENVI